VEAVLGPERAKAFCYVYDVSPEGNFEGKSILNRPKTLEQCAAILRRDAAELKDELAADRAALLAVRNGRVWPGLDDKVLVSWNGLAIDALAPAAGALAEPRYLAAAQRAAGFILRTMRRPDGRLLHSFRNGKAKFDAYLDDYACLANALVSLYEADFDERWVDEAVGLADVLLARFADAEGGGFYFTADDHERLIARHKDAQDASVPSGNAMAATALARLGKLCGRQDYVQAADRTLSAFAATMARWPTAAGQMLLALDFQLGPTPELVLLADGADDQVNEVLAALRARFVPNKVVACRSTRDGAAGRRSAALDPVFERKSAAAGGVALYVCQDFACQAPATGLEPARQVIGTL
jgi:uncharacterized protein YyaL (SSP411 family)